MVAEVNPNKLKDKKRGNEEDEDNEYDYDSYEELVDIGHEDLELKKRSEDRNSESLGVIESVGKFKSIIDDFAINNMIVTMGWFDVLPAGMQGGIEFISVVQQSPPGEKYDQFMDVYRSSLDRSSPDVSLLSEDIFNGYVPDLTAFNELSYDNYDGIISNAACVIGAGQRLYHDREICHKQFGHRCTYASALIDRDCRDRYLPGILHEGVVKITELFIESYCSVASDNEVKPVNERLFLDYESEIAQNIGLYERIKDVAYKMDFIQDLKEVEDQYFVETSLHQVPSLYEFQAAVVIDKCEMRGGDLRDYKIPQLESCDIQGLYRCKNKKKMTSCRGTLHGPN